MHPMISIAACLLWMTPTTVGMSRIMDIATFSLSQNCGQSMAKARSIGLAFRMIRSVTNLAMFVFGPFGKCGLELMIEGVSWRKARKLMKKKGFVYFRNMQIED